MQENNKTIYGPAERTIGGLITAGTVTRPVSKSTLFDQFILSQLESRELAAPGININYIGGELNDAAVTSVMNMASVDLYAIAHVLQTNTPIKSAEKGTDASQGILRTPGGDTTVIKPRGGFLNVVAGVLTRDRMTEFLLNLGLPDFQFAVGTGSDGKTHLAIGTMDRNHYFSGMSSRGVAVGTYLMGPVGTNAKPADSKIIHSGPTATPNATPSAAKAAESNQGTPTGNQAAVDKAHPSPIAAVGNAIPPSQGGASSSAAGSSGSDKTHIEVAEPGSNGTQGYIIPIAFKARFDADVQSKGWDAAVLDIALATRGQMWSYIRPVGSSEATVNQLSVFLPAKNGINSVNKIPVPGQSGISLKAKGSVIGWEALGYNPDNAKNPDHGITLQALPGQSFYSANVKVTTAYLNKADRLKAAEGAYQDARTGALKEGKTEKEANAIGDAARALVMKPNQVATATAADARLSNGQIVLALLAPGNNNYAVSLAPGAAPEGEKPKGGSSARQLMSPARQGEQAQPLFFPLIMLRLGGKQYPVNWNGFCRSL